MRKDEKRHATLGCTLSFFEDNMAENLARRFLGLGDYPPQESSYYFRKDDIWHAVNALSLHHLGFELTKPPEFFLERGFDVAVDYFCGDWWNDDEDAQEFLDKTTHRDNLEWVTEFTHSLLLGLLSERWDDVSRICSWVEADLVPEYMGGFFEPELVHVYRSIAAGLRSSPMPGLDMVERQILNCRLERPKVLFRAWQAARARDQSQFEKAFVDAVAHFGRYFDPEHSERCDYAAPFDWIAPHHSVVAMAAVRLGMRLPQLTPKQEAWIMTRESLGLPSRKE